MEKHVKKSLSLRIMTRLERFPTKLMGVDFTKQPKRELFHEYMKSTIGSFLALALLSAVDEFWLTVEYKNVYLLYGSFGSSVVLYHCAPKAPIAQPLARAGSRIGLEALPVATALRKAAFT